jgi:hypothetical protein
MKIGKFYIITENKLWEAIIENLYDMLHEFREEIIKSEFPEDLDLKDYARPYTNKIEDKL